MEIKQRIGFAAIIAIGFVGIFAGYTGAWGADVVFTWLAGGELPHYLP